MKPFANVKSSVGDSLKRLADELQAAQLLALRDATSAAQQHAMSTKLWKDGDGVSNPKHLRQNIKAKVSGKKGSVKADRPYASFLEFGTKAHGPVTANMLHWHSFGVHHFAKWVRGISPRPFMKEAYLHGLTVQEHAAEHYVSEAIARFNR